MSIIRNRKDIVLGLVVITASPIYWAYADFNYTECTVFLQSPLLFDTLTPFHTFTGLMAAASAAVGAFMLPFSGGKRVVAVVVASFCSLYLHVFWSEIIEAMYEYSLIALQLKYWTYSVFEKLRY